MIASMQRRPLLAVLAVAAVVLLLAIGLETGFGTRLRLAVPQEPSKKAAAPEAKILPPLVAVAPEQAYPETAARPLFTPTRRPAPADPAAGKIAFNRGQFVLQGVIVVGEERTALLKEKTSGKIHRVERGKDVNGIKVEKIEPTEVTLAMNGEQEKLALVVQRPEGAPGARGAPAGAPVASTSTEATQGPFGAAAAAPQGATNLTATAPAATDPAQVNRAFGANSPNPVARLPASQPQAAQQPSTQPMSPEELLARRRARRNQPTQ
jgi:hypothetical protein